MRNDERDAKFLAVKESFDRIVFLNKESNGQLFMSMDQLSKAKRAEKDTSREMSSLKQRM